MVLFGLLGTKAFWLVQALSLTWAFDKYTFNYVLLTAF